MNGTGRKEKKHTNPAITGQFIFPGREKTQKAQEKTTQKRSLRQCVCTVELVLCALSLFCLFFFASFAFFRRH
jgi:hypothetical protein